MRGREVSLKISRRSICFAAKIIAIVLAFCMVATSSEDVLTASSTLARLYLDPTAQTEHASMTHSSNVSNDLTFPNNLPIPTIYCNGRSTSSLLNNIKKNLVQF